MPAFLIDGPEDGPRLVLAHGAGAPMDHPWMSEMAALLAAHNIRVVRFEFSYMAARRGEAGRRRGPSPAPTLEREWRDVADELGDPRRFVIGGKSMGGRIASIVADALGVAGVVAFGYPFHPPGKPQQLRTAHLETMQTPMLVLQGERDTFGNVAEVSGYRLSPALRVSWLPDGDHSLVPRKAPGHTRASNLALAAREAAAFVHSVTA